MSVVINFFVLVIIFKIFMKIWCFWSKSKVCLVGKTAIITGGASGLGFQTALVLAAKGCRVIIADITNISQAVEAIIKETHNPNIIGKRVDLQSFRSVREFAKDIRVTEPRLDILLCNAGIAELGEGKYTEDGLHRTMQINYFSHFLLTHLLLDLLKHSAPSRIVYTSSLIAYLSDLTPDMYDPKVKGSPTLRTKLTAGYYSHSKLALALAAKLFGEKLKGTGVTANAAHPAGVKTQIFANTFKNELNPLTIVWSVIVFFYGKNSEEGAQTLIHLAQSDEVKNITGQSFYEGMRVLRPPKLYSEDFCNKIWDLSVEITNLEQNEIKC